MTGANFQPFFSNNKDDLNILSIAATYPSQVQPWMINHLLQIEKNGGHNRIISISKDKYCFDSELAQYDLCKYYWNLGSSNKTLLINALSQLINSSILSNTFRLLKGTTWPEGFRKKIKQSLTAYSMTLNADIIHSHSEPVGFRLLHLIKANKAPFVHTFHGQTPVGVPTISRHERAQYSQHARAILVNTNFARRQYENLGAKNSNFAVIPQGTNIDKWDYFPLQCPNKNEQLNILTVGRVVEEKGHRYVIDAVNMLRCKNINVHYHIVGSGPQIVELKKQIKQLQLEGYITLHGVLTGQDLSRQYSKAHIFVLPSLKGDGDTWEETQGVVIQEAQSSGVLVICADSGGIAECVIDGVNGFIVPDRDAKAISRKVEELLSVPSRWKEWQENGRDWVVRNYSLNVIGQRYYNFYKDLL